MTALKIAFWICLALVFYTYVGYGLLLFVLVRIKRLLGLVKPLPDLPTDERELPTVTLMICAYNEQDVIAEKMQNIRQLN
jgi:cellulose synthase/poly-beta-1,6-N-acetylglucosamine synthase-like glycosyltransferase